MPAAPTSSPAPRRSRAYRPRVDAGETDRFFVRADGGRVTAEDGAGEHELAAAPRAPPSQEGPGESEDDGLGQALDFLAHVDRLGRVAR